jgi:hypothetical protein
MKSTLTYREMTRMPSSVREHFLGSLSDEEYRLLMAMVVYHTRRDARALHTRTVGGLIVEGRIRFARQAEQVTVSVG